MPKYYFDVARSNSGSATHDPVDLADEECARQFADGFAEMLRGDDEQSIEVIIRDEKGTLVERPAKSDR